MALNNTNKKSRYSAGDIVNRSDYNIGVEVLSVDGHWKDLNGYNGCWHYTVKCLEHGNVFTMNQNELGQMERGERLPNCAECRKLAQRLQSRHAIDKTVIPDAVEQILNGPWV